MGSGSAQASCLQIADFSGRAPSFGTPHGIYWTARLRGYEAMTILADERVLSTPGFPSAR